MNPNSVACSRSGVVSKLHRVPFASHRKGQIPLERHWLWGSSSSVTTWEESFHPEELAKLFSRFICMKGLVLRKELLGRLAVACGWWDLSYWCYCVRRTKMSLTVRSWEKACSSQAGKKDKTLLSALLLIFFFFNIVLKAKSILNLLRLNLWFCQIFFSILAFQSLWTDL